MNDQQVHSICDSDQLNALLTGDLSNSELVAVESHLSECTACADQIQLAAAPGMSWNEAQTMLATDEFDGQPSLSSISSLLPEPEERGQTTTADLLMREIRGWLDPTDDPQMLGRFAGYEIVGIIGHGGMGIVLKGFEASLNRYVAIKVLAPRLATNDAARRRFAREAQAAAAVLHENVVAIHRVAECHGLPFLVMPYVAGISLQTRVDDEGPLQLEAILRIGSQIAAGLAAAHQQGLVHRDIKPANILLDKGVERVTITDFGLARAVDDASVTRTGIIAGPPQYMSPEQTQAKPLDARSDLFSLGSVLYAICTGRPPFHASTGYAVMSQIADVELTPIRDINPNIPEWLSDIIAKLMSKRPLDRYSSACEVAELLAECLAEIQESATARPRKSQQRTVHTSVRRKSRIRKSGVIAVCAALGLGLLGFMFFPSVPAPNISGNWTGEGWGEIVLKQKQPGAYDGTCSLGNGTRTLSLKWSSRERRFNGTWSTAKKVGGRISLRLVDGKIRGAWTTKRNPNAKPKTPRLSDLLWARHDPLEGNVALSRRGATIEGPDSHPQNLLDGKTTGYHGTRGWARSLTPDIWTVTLPRNYLLRQIRLLLYDRDTRKFHYKIDTSVDGKTYDVVADRSKEWARSWQIHSFPERAVKYIRIHCLNSSYNNRPREDGFFAVELEAYCRPPKSPLQVPGLRPQSLDLLLLERLRRLGATIKEENGVFTEFTFGNSSKITDTDLLLLKSLDKLESFTLIGCPNVTDEGFANLRYLTRLKGLNLSPSTITDAGLKHVSGMKDLWMLGLNSTRVTDAGLQHLINNRNITVLYVNNTKITDKGLTFLEQMKDMYWMDLEGTGISDVGLAHLGHMSKMKLLSLGRTKVTDAGLPRLQRFSNLELLGLNNTAVTDSGMAELAKISSLKQLILTDTSVTDAGLIHLARLKNLKELQLYDTQVTKGGVDALLEALPKCEVKYLRETQKPADDFSKYGEGAALMKWASTKLKTGSKTIELKVNDKGRVTSVHMGGGMITDEGLSHLKNMKDVEQLILSYTYGCSAESLKYVQQMTKVNYLRLWGNYHFSDGVGYLSKMTNVETLYLHKLRVTDENMKFVRGMTRCKLIQMTLNPTITDKGIAHLAGLTELETIYLTCDRLTDDCLKHFEKMKKLKSLTVVSPQMTKAGLERLSKLLPNLKTVNNEPLEKFIEKVRNEKKDAETKTEKPKSGDAKNKTANAPPLRFDLGFVPSIEKIKRDQHPKFSESQWPAALEEIRKGMAKEFPKLKRRQDYRGEHGTQHLNYGERGRGLSISLMRFKTPQEAGKVLRRTDMSIALRTTDDIRVKGVGDEAYVYGTAKRTGSFMMCFSNVYIHINSTSRDWQLSAAKVIDSALKVAAKKSAPPDGVSIEKK